MKTATKKGSKYYSPETVSGACMSGKRPSIKELKELTDFIAERKTTVKAAAKKRELKSVME